MVIELKNTEVLFTAINLHQTKIAYFFLKIN